MLHSCLGAKLFGDCIGGLKMRRWNELKIWEKQYYKKRILIWAIVIVLLIAAAAAGFYVISHRPEAPQEVSEKLEEYPWEDTFTGQPFRAVDDNFDETPLSENVSLVTVQVAYQNSKRDTREFVWWKTQEPDLWFNLPAEGNCQSGAYIQRSKQNGEESELYTSDFFILYGMGYYDGSAVVFCVVSADPDVHDTAGSEVIQIKRDNLYCYEMTVCQGGKSAKIYLS